MLPAVVQHVFVDFVGQHQDGPAPDQRCERVQVLRREHAARGVVRVVDDDQPRTVAQRGAHPVPVDAEVRCAQWQMDAATAGEADGRVVGVIRRIEDDGLVTRAHGRLDGRVDGLGAAAGHREFGFGINGSATAGRDLGGDGGAQRDAAFHGSVLIEPRGHRFGDAGGEIGIDGIVGKALADIDRALFGGPA